MIEHDHVSVGLDLLLYESKQMLLIHAGGRVNVRVNFPHVVEVSVRHRLLLSDLLELVEHAVEFELWFQILQTLVAEGLERSVADHAHQQMVIVDKHLQVWVDKVTEGLVGVLGAHDSYHAVDHFELARQFGQGFDVERIAHVHWRINGVIV